MEILSKITGELANNTYILVDGTDCIIIDPPKDAKKIDSMITDRRLKPVAMMLTHGHWDHFWGISYFYEKYKIPLYMAKSDFYMVEEPYSEIHNSHLPIKTNVEFKFLEGGKTSIEGFAMEVIATPGHSPGGLCFYMEDLGEIITGDTLFRGTVGRWDFTGGHKDTLMKSIQKKLYTLPGETVVRPGHGFRSTIEWERVNNDSVRG